MRGLQLLFTCFNVVDIALGDIRSRAFEPGVKEHQMCVKRFDALAGQDHGLNGDLAVGKKEHVV